jgi:ubiquitin-conjugating enzyme E2 variant
LIPPQRSNAQSPSAVSPAARQRWIDRSAVVLFAVLWTMAFARLHPALLEPDFALANLAGGISGYLLAEFVAGAVHWIADRHFDPETPWIGPMLIEPFRAHHDDPLSITRHDFFEVLGNNALVTIPVTGVLLIVARPETSLASFAVSLSLVGTLAAVATNLFHAWAHSAEPPRIGRWLQARGLILTPRQHALHHRAGHDRAYCVTSGWLNPLLDRTRFFGRLDTLIERSGRPRPRSGGSALASAASGRERTASR